MIELEIFLNTFLPLQIKAEKDIHNGILEPRLELWTKNDPVTLFGAFGPCNVGTEAVTKTFEWVASVFSNCSEYNFELIAADISGDLAYTVGYEHSIRSVNNGPQEASTLRVTHIYRRENNEWKIVHRHADFLPKDQSPSEALNTGTVKNAR